MPLSTTLPPFVPPFALAPIRVAPGGRYFETTDGAPFLFIGFNDAITWPGLSGLFNRRDLASVEQYLEHVAASGVTVLRLMLEYTHREHRYFEKPVGRFAPAMIRLWDDLFTLCARYGLRVLLTPFDTFWMSRRWSRHPYNTANGGPNPTQQLLTNEQAVDAVIARLRFVVERWGGTGVIAAWDLWNEIHDHWGGTPDEQIIAIRRIGTSVREYELACHGFTRPQTVSIFGPDPGPRSDLIFRHPDLDFATTHIYQGAIDYPLDTVQPALVMGRWVRHGLHETPPTRPFTDSEHGPIHLFNDHRRTLPEAFDDEYERRMMWAHLCSGGAGSGLRWPARHPHRPTNGMLTALSNLSRFTRACGLDWRHFRPRDASDETMATPNAPSGDGFHLFAVRDEQCFLAYLLRTIPTRHEGIAPTRSPINEGTLTLGMFESGTYHLALWDTVAGRMQATRRLEVKENQGPLILNLPPITEEVAVALCPVV